LRLSPSILKRVNALAEDWGVNRSSVLEDAITQGLAAIEELHYSAENKRLVNLRLRLQAVQIQEMLAVLEASDTRPHERAEAVEAIRKASGAVDCDRTIKQ